VAEVVGLLLEDLDLGAAVRGGGGEVRVLGRERREKRVRGREGRKKEKEKEEVLSSSSSSL
jgi:hypothetical protein